MSAFFNRFGCSIRPMFRTNQMLPELSQITIPHFKSPILLTKVRLKWVAPLTLWRGSSLTPPCFRSRRHNLHINVRRTNAGTWQQEMTVRLLTDDTWTIGMFSVSRQEWSAPLGSFKCHLNITTGVISMWYHWNTAASTRLAVNIKTLLVKAEVMNYDAWLLKSELFPTTDGANWAWRWHSEHFCHLHRDLDVVAVPSPCSMLTR